MFHPITHPCILLPAKQTCSKVAEPKQAATQPGTLSACTADYATSSSFDIESIRQIRQLEADLKRKSDLLSEVKVLLKSAAERERRQLAEGEELKRKLRLVLNRNKNFFWR